MKRRPSFLRFLDPLFDDSSDRLGLSGHVRIEARRGTSPSLVVYDDKNFIVRSGNAAVRDLLLGSAGGGFGGSVFRMALGDGGVNSGDLYNPKLPDNTWQTKTTLFHEVIRQDISVFAPISETSARFIGSFESTSINTTSFSLSENVINEAALIIGNGVMTVGGGIKQVNKTPPDTVDADEKLLSMRTFRSVSFDPFMPTTITVTWTITVGA